MSGDFDLERSVGKPLKSQCGRRASGIGAKKRTPSRFHFFGSVGRKQPQQSVTMYVLSGFGALLFVAILTCCTSTDTGNRTENVPSSFSTDLAVVSRGMKSTMYKVIPYLLVPALAMAGIMPWILPGIQLAVTLVTMLNNMAFSSALFMLIRNYIFNTQQEEHIVYVNHGYKNKNKHKQR